MANTTDTKNQVIQAFDLLPNVFKSDVNRALFENGFQKFLTKPETRDVVGIIGETTNTDQRLKESQPQRDARQLQPMVYNKIGEVEQVMSFKDMMNELERVGVDISRMAEWCKADQFNFAPPIDLDKISNYRNYYWLGDTQPQYVTIKNRANQLEVIITQAFADNADLYALHQQYVASVDAVEKQQLLDQMDVIYPEFSVMILEREYIRLSDPLNQTNDSGWDTIDWDPSVVGDWDSPLDGMSIVRFSTSVIVVNGNKAGIFNVTPDFTFSVSGSGVNDGVYQVVQAQYDDVEDITTITVTDTNITAGITGGLVQVGYYDEASFDPEYQGQYDDNLDVGEFLVPNPNGFRLQTDQWSAQNFWTHIDDIPKNINVNLLQRAELPIIEYNAFMVLNEWSYTRTKWLYRKDVATGFTNVDDQPSDEELHFIDRHIYRVGSFNGNIVVIPKNNNPAVVNAFNVGSEITLEFNDRDTYDYYTIVDTVESDDDITLTVDRIVPRDAQAEFSNLHNIRYTSKGDDWKGVYHHWVYDGVHNPVPVSAQVLNDNLIPGNDQYGVQTETVKASGVNTHWYRLENIEYIPGKDLVRVYANNQRLYGSFSEGYFDGSTYTTTIPEGANANAIRLNDGVGFGTIRVESGPAAQSDVLRVEVPVRLSVNDETYKVERIPLIEYRLTEQVKINHTQYPLFDIFNIDGTTAYRANSIWKFHESPTASVNANVNARIVSSTKDFKFEQQLVDSDDGVMFAYKEREQSNVEATLQTIWKRSDDETSYSPMFIDSDGNETTVGDPNGDWEIPKQMRHNLEHENRRVLGTIELNQHFKSIIDSQPNPPGFASDDTKRWRSINKPDHGLGGTIKEFNGSFDTLISVVFNDIVNIPKLIDFAADQYEDSINVIRDMFEQHIDDYLRSQDSEFLSNLTHAIADDLVNKFERNGIRDRVFGDTTAHDGTKGVRGWMATLPMVGMVKPSEPRSVIDTDGGVYELVHHDGHVTSPVILESVINDILSRITKSNYGEVGLEANLRDGSTVVPGYVYYATDTKTTFRYDVAHRGQSTPSLKEGQYWYNTLTNTMFKMTNGSFEPANVNDAWTKFDFNDLFINVLLDIEQRLYSVTDASYETYDIESIKQHPLFVEYEQREFEKFVKRFGIDASTTTSFSAVNAFTWNYSSVDVSNYRVNTIPTSWNDKAPSTWFSIYNDLFGTRYPNIEPWVMQGFDSKPLWWDAEYAGTSRKWSTNMWNNILQGIVPLGQQLPSGIDSTGVSGEVKTYSTVGVNITDDYTKEGNYAPDALLPPYFNSTFIEDLVAQQSGAVLSVAPLMSAASDGFKYGDNGPIEDSWKRSVYYVNSVAAISFMIDPMNFCASVIHSGSTVVNGLQLDLNTQRVASHRHMKFHGEAYPDGVITSKGLNQWFVNFLRYTSRDVETSGFRSSWVDWRPKLGYQSSTFIDTRSLSLSTEISQLDESDINVMLKHTRGMQDKWIDALRVVVGTVGEHTYQMGVRIPKNKGADWKFRIDTANPSLRSIKLYGIDTSGPTEQFVPRITNVNSDTWLHHQIDRSKVLEYRPGTPIADLDPAFDGIQGVVNFIDAYAAYLQDEGFNFNNTRYAQIDADTSRTIDWQFEIERLIEQVYVGMSSDELPVHFLGPWNYIFADINTNEFVVTGSLNVKEGDKVQLATAGVLPIPFDSQKEYFIVNATANAFQLAQTQGGTPITIASTGHGALSIGTYRIDVVSPVSYHEVNPFRYSLVLDHETGIVSDVINNVFKDIDVEQGLYDQYGRPLHPENLRTYRSDDVTRFIADQNVPNDVTRSADVDDNIHISGAHVMLNGFEHVILFNDDTVEGNTLFDEFLGASVSRFKISMRTQVGESFRPNIGGHYLHDGQILQNIEASIIELQQLYDVNLADENSPAVKAARELVGFERTEYFDNMGITPKSQFLFHRGAIQHKGATKSVQAFINSRQFVEADVDEYWAYKITEFGDAREQIFPEIRLEAKDAATDKLMLQFTTGETADNGFIDVKRDDQTRWFNHPEQMVDVLGDDANLTFESEVTTHLTVEVAEQDDLIVLDQPADGVRLVADIDETASYQHVAPGNNDEYTLDTTLIENTDCVDVVIKPHDGTRFLPQTYGESYTVEADNKLMITHVNTSNGVREIEQDDVIRFTAKNVELVEGTHFERVNARVVRLLPEFKQYGLVVNVYALNVAASKLTPVKLIDYQSNTNVQTIPIWDPARGRHYHVSSHAIDVTGTDDPAHYNVSFDNNINRNLAWYENNVGSIWWDTTKLGYTPYYDDKVVSDTDTRVTQWGKQSQWSSVDLYEWVESPVPPSEYVTYVEDQQKAGNSIQGAPKHSVLKRTRATENDAFDDTWIEIVPVVVEHLAAVNMTEVNVSSLIDDGETVQVYRNGELLIETTVANSNVALPNNIEEQDYITVVSERYEPTSDDLEFDPDLKDDGRLVQYKLDYKYTEIQRIAANEIDVNSTYYFWVSGSATSHDGMTLKNISADLTKLPIPFVIFQNLMEMGSDRKYNQSVFRGLVDIINADDRYKLRYTKDFTLRNDIDDADSSVNLKNKHEEWALFREKQKFNIPKTLWNKMVEALIGRTLTGVSPVQPIPSLDRELFDSVNSTTHRFGLNPGQAFVDSERGLSTVLAELQDPEYDLFPIDREEFFANNSFDTADNIERAMDTIYNTFLPDTVNRIWFAVLHDGLADNINYSGIMKTSWIQLDGVRLLDTTGVLT